jgi:hypothetical protein
MNDHEIEAKANSAKVEDFGANDCATGMFRRFATGPALPPCRKRITSQTF